MAPRRRPRRVVATLLAVLLACSAGADGEPCETSDDCESGTCSVAGRCGTGECACEGDECGRIRGACPEGAVCVRPVDPLERDYPVCRFTCDAERRCPAGQHCERGICEPGPEPFGLTWASLPRATPCALRRPCDYRVTPAEGVVVDRYEWTISSGGAEQRAETTTVPELVHAYAEPGIYEVRVLAHGRGGATGTLSATETLCVPEGEGRPCVTSAPCCSGVCTVESLCR